MAFIESELKLRGNQCMCVGCGEIFSRASSFDKHRTGDFARRERRCLSPDEMISRKMTRNARGVWIGEQMTEGQRPLSWSAEKKG